jgi:hypothetical protein
VVVTDIPTIEHILLKQTKSLDRARQTTSIFQTLLPTGQIALPTNDQWKHHRRIVGPAMTSKYLSLATPVANQAVSDLIDYLKVKASVAGDHAFEVEKDLEAGTIVSRAMRVRADVQDAICGMAFGASWGVCKSFRDQVAAAKPVIGGLNEANFKLTDPPMLQSMLYLFNTVDQFSPSPRLTNYISSLKPAYRRHEARLNAYLKEKTKEARKEAQAKGADAAVETATNTLDMMVARELRGEDWMSENEMRDELYLCESSFFCGGLSRKSAMTIPSPTPSLTRWNRDECDDPRLVVQVHDQSPRNPAKTPPTPPRASPHHPRPPADV